MNGDAGPTSEERAVADVEVLVNGNDHTLETEEGGEEGEEEDEDEGEQGEGGKGYEEEEVLYDEVEQNAQASVDLPPAPTPRRAKELEPEEARHRPREPLSCILQSLQTVSLPLPSSSPSSSPPSSHSPISPKSSKAKLRTSQRRARSSRYSATSPDSSPNQSTVSPQTPSSPPNPAPPPPHPHRLRLHPPPSSRTPFRRGTPGGSSRCSWSWILNCRGGR